jgi:putative FmdB family regulatory protein
VVKDFVDSNELKRGGLDNMPFYDYRCTACGNEMPMQLRKYEEKEIQCPECDGVAERLYNFRFIAHGLPNGHIAAPNTARREVVQKNPNDRRIDPNKFASKKPEE